MITLVVVGLISITAITTLSGSLLREVSVRNDHFRSIALMAASSEIGAQVREVNSNDPEADDPIILDLFSTVGSDREFELEIGNSNPTNPILTSISNTDITSAGIEAEISTSFPCPGSSIGSVNVMLGSLRVESSVASTGFVSSQQRDFVYCWP